MRTNIEIPEILTTRAAEAWADASRIALKDANATEILVFVFTNKEKLAACRIAAPRAWRRLDQFLRAHTTAAQAAGGG
jgi:hypothetical protein